MAGNYFVNIKAAKQGELKGESGKNPTNIPIFGFQSEIISPRDPQSGLPTGKRIHKPITIYKEWGVISPQLLSALANNENLPSVAITEVRTNAQGKESVYMEIHLTNATISGIQIEPQRSENQPFFTKNEIEAVSFTYQKIEVTNKVSSVTAVDDWEISVT